MLLLAICWAHLNYCLLLCNIKLVCKFTVNFVISGGYNQVHSWPISLWPILSILNIINDHHDPFALAIAMVSLNCNIDATVLQILWGLTKNQIV